MKAVVTRQNKDGTFDQVGMNNRTVIGPYKRESTIISYARDFAGKSGLRIELYMGDSVLGKPSKVLQFEPINTETVKVETAEEKVARLITKLYVTEEDLSLSDDEFRLRIAERICDDLQ